MTAPERIWAFNAPEIGEDNPQCSIVAGEHVMHGAQAYTRTDIHQAALDRIAELEGALAFYAKAENYRSTGGMNWVEGDAGVTARAVLAKGDG